ncbi:SEC-C metal-binding domain-containing protein [Paludibaculum fermentans]|uniref:SEC-C domain-containing protein n=1 Tax=Paludibaculum fermentans TaxID=1473598 RepID=A0A7S7SM98_PALFE|nr:SEC-C metal-binding domain-containing protein [Paludibaculum fermentans]QOY91027.1 SEC-C domain-containing protein [Paludibaculum fermentans]
MATNAQLDANRANALRSTGPRSEEGKARSSRNNLRYGFRSQSVLLPGDDPAEFADLLAELSCHFAVDDLSSARYVREMADAEWRLRRVRLHQELLLCERIAKLSETRPDASPQLLQALAFEALHAEAAFNRFLTYEAKFERQYERACQGLRKLREAASKKAPAQVVELRPNRTVEPNSESATPRNAPCPCGSGEKYKRCCGRNAPAVVTAAPHPDPSPTAPTGIPR